MTTLAQPARWKVSPTLAGDLWGGLAAMLVALPSAIAFGVTIYAPLGDRFAAQGALAGILGATAMGLIAASFGGTNRLISAPCAPAVAVLSAFTIQRAQQGADPASSILMLALIALFAGALQVGFGAVRLGRLIKYMPFPVVSGYLSGVGLYIIGSQVPKLLGVPKYVGAGEARHAVHFWESLTLLPLWQWQGIVVGLVTIVAMVFASKLTKLIPAAIIGLAAGVVAYFAIALSDPAMLALSGNGHVVGPVSAGGGQGGGFGDMLVARFSAFGALRPADAVQVLVPAATLAVLLSIDTLKTAVVLDTLTRSRHNSNRELVAQGLGNIGSTLVGGMPGAGTMGATLVNISSGAQTRLSGILEGLLSLVAFLVLSPLIAWIPVAALSGILIVVGVKMIDRHSLDYLTSRSTVLDFAVIASVVVVALTVSMIAASAVGIALAILLFVREQIGGSVVRRQALGNRVFSKQVRLPEEMATLERAGDRTAIFELQGSLFFGTTDQLYTVLEPEIKARQYIILDMRRVQSIDVTAVHMLEQVEDALTERGAMLILSHLPSRVATGHENEVDLLGRARPRHRVRAFEELDDALEWVEDRILADEHLNRALERAIDLREIGLFQGRRDETLADLEAVMEQRAVRAGQTIFARGDDGDELYLIRRGLVRIMLPLETGKRHHLATFGRGDFFGEMAFLDRERRSADAVASTDVDLYVLSRRSFDELAADHRKLANTLLEGIARMLAIRLRYANAELRTIEAS